MLTVESVREEDVLRVKGIQNWIGIELVSCGENYDLEVFGDVLEERDGVRADMDTGGHGLVVWEYDG